MSSAGEGASSAATGPVLRFIVEQALAVHRFLLTDDETRILDTFLGLPPGPFDLYARLLSRIGELFRRDRLRDGQHLHVLVEAGFVDSEVPWQEACTLLTVAELAALCRAQGLDARGRRSELLRRLMDLDLPRPFAARTLHRALFQRMKVLFFRDPHADHRIVILDRLGIRRRPSYQISEVIPTFPDRASMLAFEDGVRRLADPDPLLHLDWALDVIRTVPVPPLAERRLSVRCSALKIAREAARILERAGRTQEAVHLYEVLLPTESEDEDLLLRAVLALEASGRPAEALALADTRRSASDLALTLALERTGHRLARKHRLPWRPWPPVRRPVVRHLRMEAAGRRAGRTLWRVDGQDGVVEEAVARLLRTLGRRVLRGEGTPWTTLFGLLLYDLYWLPVPGMLSVPYLSGPLDLGTPDFAASRESELHARLAEMTQSDPSELLRTTYAAHHGEAIHGVDWQIPVEDLVDLVGGLGGRALAAVIGTIAHSGWRATRGLPDLVVLAGQEIQIPNAIPAYVGPDLLLVEVKGPKDRLRDDQRAWLHRLGEMGVRAEVWEVGPLTGRDQGSTVSMA